MKTYEILSKVKKDGLEKEACSAYNADFEHLLKWTVSFNESDCFHWRNLNDALWELPTAMDKHSPLLRS
jgi:hypothetical protein